MSNDALSRRSPSCARVAFRHNRPRRAAARRELREEIAEQAAPILLEVVRLRPPLFSSLSEILDKVPLDPGGLPGHAREYADTVQQGREKHRHNRPTVKREHPR